MSAHCFFARHIAGSHTLETIARRINPGPTLLQGGIQIRYTPRSTVAMQWPYVPNTEAAMMYT
jgi:hypothetical protein